MVVVDERGRVEYVSFIGVRTRESVYSSEFGGRVHPPHTYPTHRQRHPEGFFGVPLTMIETSVILVRTHPLSLALDCCRSLWRAPAHPRSLYTRYL